MVNLKEALEQMRGEYVDIYTKHRLFDDQHIRMKFDPETEIGFGFHCKGQTIYIRDDDIIEYEIQYSSDCKVIINGNDMTIKIIKRA